MDSFLQTFAAGLFAGGLLMAGATWLLKAGITAKLDHTLEKLKSSLGIIEQREAEYFELREKSYGQIWTLTGALRLFGSQPPIDAATLSDDLGDWYFAHGQALTKEQKAHYFLVQEVLMVARIEQIAFQRPADTKLYCTTNRTTAELDSLRAEVLGFRYGQAESKLSDALRQASSRPSRGKRRLSKWWRGKRPSDDSASASSEELLQDIVNDWKGGALAAESQAPADAQKAWVILQWLLSTLRSRLEHGLRAPAPLT